GLGVAGMTSPRKIVGFLDVFGAWDASLLVVMAGGVGVFAVGHRLALRRGAPLAADRFFVSPPGPLTARHVLGAVLFGAGWGIAGYCPGPAVVALASGAAAPVVFTAAMIAGMFLPDLAGRALARARLDSGLPESIRHPNG
ncbi:MAG TPA: DUF6691 family protein, partial [Polyangiaceae bacterium]|nr:DUF6691 family protein [Polyangiaceae bacterium]